MNAALTLLPCAGYRFTRSLSWVLFLVLFSLPENGLWHSVCAQERASESKPSSRLRFVFLVDTSASSRREAPTARNTIYDLVSSGMNKTIQPGDLWTIWTWGSDLNKAVFPLKSWSPETRWDLANQAAQFMREVDYTGLQNDSMVSQALDELLTRHPLLTVFIISNSNLTLRGTPYDSNLNAIYEENGRGLRRSERPFVTTLVLYKGDYMGWAVDAGGGEINIPAFKPPVEKVQPSPIEQVSTNPPTLPEDRAPPESTATSPVESQDKQSETTDELSMQNSQSLEVTVSETPTNSKVESRAKGDPSSTIPVPDLSIPPLYHPETTVVQGSVEDSTEPTPTQANEKAMDSSAAISPPLKETEDRGASLPSTSQTRPISVESKSNNEISSSGKNKVPEPQESVSGQGGGLTKKGSALSSTQQTNVSREGFKSGKPGLTSGRLAPEIYLVVAGILFFGGLFVMLLLWKKQRTHSGPSLISQSIDQDS